jgi:hypothetical protein
MAHALCAQRSRWEYTCLCRGLRVGLDKSVARARGFWNSGRRRATAQGGSAAWRVQWHVARSDGEQT